MFADFPSLHRLGGDGVAEVVDLPASGVVLAGDAFDIRREVLNLCWCVGVRVCEKDEETLPMTTTTTKKKKKKKKKKKNS